MRITENQRLVAGLRDIQTAERATARLSEQVSSGRAVRRPSDDPTRAARAVRLKGELRAIEAAGLNADVALTELQAIDSELQRLSGVLGRARELGIQGSSEALTPQDRATLAAEVEGLLEQALASGNARFDGRFLFAGTQTAQQPFELQTVAGVTLASYLGSDIPREITVSAVRVPIGPAGGDPFTGSGGALDALIALRDALNAGPTTAIRAAVDGIDLALDSATRVLGDLGARQAEVSNLADGLEERRILVEQVRSAVEDVDLSRAIVELRDRQADYERSLQVVSGILQVSILDFLR